MKKILIAFAIASFSFSSNAQNVFPTPSGNVLINSTTDNGVDKLQVNGSVKAYSLNLSNPGSLAELTVGVPNDGIYYNNIGIYSQYKSSGLTWSFNQDYQGNHLTAGLPMLYFTVGSGSKIINFDQNGNASFGGSVSVGDNGGGTSYKINLSKGNSNHYLYSTGSGGNNFYFGEFLTGISTGFHWVSTANNAEIMTLNGLGNLGIGTTNPSEKLAVNGTIRSKEIKVEAGPWPDYVFKTSYQLQPLSQLAAYVLKNGHLPGIPSEQEVVHKGVNLGEMNRLLLQKVEEMTLYLIDKDKKYQSLENNYQSLQNEVKQLKRTVKKISKHK